MRSAAALIAALLLSACVAPQVQTPLTPPAGFAGPRIEADAFVVRDGARLAMRSWAPLHRGPDVAIVALHGVNDSSAAWRLAGPWWAENGAVTYAYDQRGFGRSPGRGIWPGELMQDDLRDVVDLVRARHPGLPVVVVGESMGGAVGIAAFASDDPPEADRLVLLGPAVWGWSSQNLLNRVSLWLTARVAGSYAVEPPEWATRQVLASDNWIELIRSGRDPAFITATRFDVVHGLVDLMETASRDLGRTGVPTLLLYGAHDDLVPKPAMRRALERAGAPPNLRTGWYEEGRHLLNRDLFAVVVYADVLSFARDPTVRLPSGAPPVMDRLPSR
ncbi:MAG: lysophospholipase [Caulobacteraceae bacterium]|nr:lysophospholipase [Caulobacteraceae bacterium]